ncbi:2-polyprenyl-6-methoxyphenol hydroxylase [Psychromonas sp. B3M02]|uniref:FAD-dependent monooxygenase n=1 Tax=Psychromonas sp. B3M02 TaxID=2267226 RepID=UPI000DEB1F7E|nr:FAD-dependent monooxygenase [Psychromonas sp. B3M02]RBW42442.1 2-polyprenyl-6-methoxyphenol hydroxylase [Psychromonas sp. B3M02]
MANTEVIIVGGGMVGALSALLLAQQGNTVHLIEKSVFQMPTHDDPVDLRVSAFSAQSKLLLEQADVWKDIPADRLCPYKGLQTWEKGSQKLVFSSDDIGAEQLGYIAENRWIQAVLWQALQALTNVYIYQETQVIAIQQDAKQVSVTLQNQQVIEAELLLACDGANSAVRNHLQMPMTSWDYRHHCLLINITTDSAQQDITWQEFRETGPCAFLPLAGHHASLVWYHSPQKIKHLQSLNNLQLKQAIKDEFPALDFEFEVDAKGGFPLTRRHAQHYYQGRVALLGDAAHTINPLAGQGVNLGFKDVQCLVELLTECSDLGIPEILKRYQCKRKPANLLMQTGMDIFYKVSKSESNVVRVLRKGFLGAAQQSGQLKTRVMRYAMGIN